MMEGFNLDPALIPTIKWQPIDTAPQDGTRILVTLFLDGELQWICDAHFDATAHCVNQQGCWVNSEYADTEDPDYGILNDPTHWMPLPAPPEHKTK